MKRLRHAVLVLISMLGLACVGEAWAHAQEKAAAPEPTPLGKWAGWRALSERGMLLYREGKLEEAESLLEKALAQVERDFSPTDKNVVRAAGQLAMVYSEEKKYAEAERLYKRALKVAETQYGPDRLETASILDGLALVYARQGKYSEAEPYFKRALAATEKAQGPDHTNVANVLTQYANLLRRTDRAAEAEKMEARARKIRGEPEPAPAGIAPESAGARPSLLPTPARSDQGQASLAGQNPPEARLDTAAPGMRLSYREKSRDSSKGFEVVTCVLEAGGFPGEKSYTLVGQWMNGQTAEVAKGIHIDESGRVIASNGKEVEMGLAGMFPGEFVVFSLASEDGTARGKVEITPFPIQAEGKGGCRLSVRPMDVKGLVFSITGSGFAPNEKLKMASSCSGEFANGYLDGRPDGSVKAVVFAGVVGRTGGDGSYEVADSSCSARVNYKWGDQMQVPPLTAQERAALGQQSKVIARSDPAGHMDPKVIRERADQGNAQAQAVLGDLYMYGEGVSKDPAAAAGWYRKSAEQGWVGGEVNLGVCYEKGMGVPKDFAEAVKWYRKAADAGNATGQKYLGDMYAKGLGVTKDWKEAEKWFAKAAAGGDEEAANFMKIPEAEREQVYAAAQRR